MGCFILVFWAARSTCFLSKIILTHNFSIKLFSINNMVLIYLLVNFLPTELLKHCGKGKRLDMFEYGWCEDKTSFDIACLKGYTSRRNKNEGWLQTSSLSSSEIHLKRLPPIQWRNELRISLQWINNIVIFSPHSCWAASSSIAKRIDVNINDIIRRDPWENLMNFLKYYVKEITEYAPDEIEFNRICRVWNNV